MMQVVDLDIIHHHILRFGRLRASIPSNHVGADIVEEDTVQRRRLRAMMIVDQHVAVFLPQLDLVRHPLLIIIVVSIKHTIVPVHADHHILKRHIQQGLHRLNHILEIIALVFTSIRDKLETFLARRLFVLHYHAIRRQQRFHVRVIRRQHVEFTVRTNVDISDCDAIKAIKLNAVGFEISDFQILQQYILVKIALNCMMRGQSQFTISYHHIGGRDRRRTKKSRSLSR
mmetsp:Transcript_2388/g.4638  ORF Transcript_2388/g.4638 Transcript_2388/m.4638 type:complete len:229 (-) Transcript_2388:226-912(-)